jgi:hypothetical protein
LSVAGVALMAGCASVERVAAPTPAPPIAAQSVPAPAAVAVPESPPVVAAPARAEASVPTPPSPAEAPTPPSTPPPDAAAKSAASTAKPPAKPATAPPPASAASATPAAKAAPAVPRPPAVAAPPAAPALDLKSLESRLRETNAIGVMTKLALKNQVDDLLDQFRMFYKGTLKTTIAELRQAYDRLVLKVLALLQDADPPLAKDIAMSREAIWSILADPVKFATV